MDLDNIQLGLVLERVDSQASLIRAASTCKRWRRFIANPVFLRRFRSRHPPTVAGNYFILSPNYRYHLLGQEPPRKGTLFVPSSPATDAGHYSLDFLADAGIEGAAIVDSRGSLLLMQCQGSGDSSITGGFPNMVVCEPLTQRFVRIPPLPESQHIQFWGCFLVDGDADGIGIDNFRLLCQLFLHSRGVNLAAVFSRGNGSDTDSSWREKAIDPYVVAPWPLLRFMGPAGGSWYFYAQGRTLVAFDGSTGEFSSSTLPEIEDWDLHAWTFDFYIAEAGTGSRASLRRSMTP